MATRKHNDSRPDTPMLLPRERAYENLATLLEDAPAFIAILMGPKGVVGLFNAQLRKLWGDRPVLGLPMRQAWPELEGQGYFELIEKVYRTGKPEHGKEVPAKIDRRNDGTLERAYFNFVFFPYRGAEGKTIGVMVHGYEVTDQVLARQKAEKSEERLNLALHASGMGTWEWNIETGELTWSPQLKKIFGVQADWPGNYDAYLKLIHPDDAARHRAAIKQALEIGGEFRSEHRIIWPDGSTHWVLEQGQVFMRNGRATRMLGTSINIDALKDTEMRLQDSEHRFRGMADSAPVLIWMAGTDKLCTYINRPWLQFTGRKVEQELGNGWLEGVHPDDREHCLQTYQRAFDKRAPFSMEYRLRRHDEVYRWMLDNGVPRFSTDGEFLGYIGSLVDIEDVRRQRELERMNAILEKQRRELVVLNRAKDEFISIASHQLRTPATTVKQYVGMLLEGYVGGLTDMQLKMLQVAYDSNERQLSIVDDLLKVAQVDAGKMKLVKRTCDLVQLLRDVIEEQHSKFMQHKQRLSCKLPDQPVIIDVDQRLIRMVLENIIDNASKYSPEGKPVEVTLRIHAKKVVVRVRDHGVGISAKDQKKLFQKFGRIHNQLSSLVSGTGLGLYWAKKIVDLHGGDITITSAADKGSTFAISLPLQS